MVTADESFTWTHGLQRQRLDVNSCWLRSNHLLLTALVKASSDIIPLTFLRTVVTLIRDPSHDLQVMGSN
jgi:hypothetical protein